MDETSTLTGMPETGGRAGGPFPTVGRSVLTWGTNYVPPSPRHISTRLLRSLSNGR